MGARQFRFLSGFFATGYKSIEPPAELVTPQRNDIVRSLNRPMHIGLFHPGANDVPAPRFYNSAGGTQSHLAKERIFYVQLFFIKFIRGIMDCSSYRKTTIPYGNSPFRYIYSRYN